MIMSPMTTVPSPARGPEGEGVVQVELHQAKPSGKVSPFREGSSIADRSYRGACNDRADARNSHQLSTVHVGACQTFDLIRYSFDAIVEISPVADDVPNDPEHPRR